ncbi:sporulation protein YqfC [Anaerocolumna sp. AGMB13025]|uniref:sporulation protein YqfC n=1 Tax=Anaerocolumna sp. AGMB13025 TaxID=3039116 RepID=UPI00241C1A76|nr:sporulation protein YqfC [Anaerocolumna sp. AGMB13025]WFR59973.1 sporulation protein YqfC [Anaerocolumna sp. AGMB13025]
MIKKLKSSHKKFKQKSNKEIYDHIEKKKKKEDTERASYLEILSSQLKLPSDMLAGAPIVTAIGRSEVCIENYKGILEYNSALIKILTKIGSIHIEGKNLNIAYFTNEEMKITGMIHTINYVNNR